jgi:uncharacterized caspase-like protein
MTVTSSQGRRLLPALLLGVLTALTFTLSVKGRADAPAGKRYALLVGVKDYEHAKLPDLKFTEADVEELYAVLRRPSAGFARSGVRLLTTSRGKKAADRPTAKNIRAALQALLGKTTRHDLVLVALAGHGVQLRGKDGKLEAFFCPTDAQLSKPETLLSLPALVKELEDAKAGVKLLLVDASATTPPRRAASTPTPCPGRRTARQRCTVAPRGSGRSRQRSWATASSSTLCWRASRARHATGRGR